MKLKIATFTLILSFFAFSVNAQNNSNKIVISGLVKDSLNRPVANASIYVNDIITNKKTNKKGFYKIKLKRTPKKIMALSPNYGLQEVVYSNTNEINFVLDMKGFDKEKFNYVVFKSKRKKNKRTTRVYTDIYDYFRDRVSGVRVSGNNEILVRGITSFNSGTGPLFVVNKSPINYIGDINPNEIKSVTILKGPECVAYGSRGANGVIIIKTY